jgi:hypothetical protein
MRTLKQELKEIVKTFFRGLHDVFIDEDPKRTLGIFYNQILNDEDPKRSFRILYELFMGSRSEKRYSQ